MQKSAPPAATPGYTVWQIVLHWLIAVLILVQWINHEDMEEWWRLIERGQETGPLPDGGAALVHIVAGVAVLVLIVARLALRWRAGAPKPPEAMPPLLRRGAIWGHYALYLLLVLLPVSGLVGVFFEQEAAEVHGFLTNILLALIALHMLGALYHLIVLRDGVFRRIFVPAPSR